MKQTILLIYIEICKCFSLRQFYSIQYQYKLLGTFYWYYDKFFDFKCICRFSVKIAMWFLFNEKKGIDMLT